MNYPVLLEKPICSNINELKQIENLKKINQIIFVNHYHFFSNIFRKFEKDLDISNINKIFVYDGNLGPLRYNFQPMLDWAPHSLGIIFRLINDEIDKVNISKFILSKKDDYETSNFKIFIKFKSGKIAWLKFGNGFRKRENKLFVCINNSKKSINFKNKKSYEKNIIINNFKTPMKYIMTEFSKSIKTANFRENYSFFIAKKTSKFIFENLI